MLSNFAGVLFDGVAYGSLLFVISIGLSVTLGLMNFINLAHGAFAMLGGYICVTLMNKFGVPFLVTLPIAFVAVGLVGGVLEVSLFRRLYKVSHLDQVLFSIGFNFIALAGAIYIWGPAQQPVRLPEYLGGQVNFLGINLGVYRLFLVGVVAVITVALVFLVARTRFGAMIRASVDNGQAAAGLGINVSRVFSITFALGSGLAGIGGGLGVPVLGLDPNFALQFLVYILLVVTVGGAGSMAGTFWASITLGVIDTAGKYYVPEIGGFVIYLAMIALLLLFPAGLNRRGAARSSAHPAHGMVSVVPMDTILAAKSNAPRLPSARWRPAEIVVWLALVTIPFALPGHVSLANQILITCVFVVSLDLILGYAGIVSVGHAAPFGLGAYVAGLLAKYGWGEPISGLICAALAGGIVGVGSSFLLRGSDITRLMVTLGITLMLFELANRLVSVTGGADGLTDVAMWKLLGLFAFDLEGRTAFYYALAVLIAVFWLSRRIVDSPFGLSLRGIREGAGRMPAIGSPVRLRLAVMYTISCAFAGIAGGLLAQTTQFVGTDSLSFLRSADLVIMLVLGGVGWLYGGILGATLFIIAQDILSGLNPAYWHFWLGILLVLIVLVARGGLGGAVAALSSKLNTKPA